MTQARLDVKVPTTCRSAARDAARKARADAQTRAEELDRPEPAGAGAQGSGQSGAHRLLEGDAQHAQHSQGGGAH